jgi:hypothetical protein
VADYRVLVTGSRDWQDRKMVFDALDAVLAEVAWAARDAGRQPWTLTVVHGQCPSGADWQARRWYWSRSRLWHGHVYEDPHPADWSRLGKGAGNARNQEMVDKGANRCLAFYWAEAANAGTADCTARAEAAGISVTRFYGGQA